MTFERLKARLDERPFRPLDLHTISGAKIRVSSREFAWLHPDHRRILIAASADEDREEMIDLKKIRKVSVAKSTRGSLSGISIELELCVANVFRMAEFLESAF